MNSDPRGAKFTPGPWVASLGSLIRVFQKGTGAVIAGVHRQGRYTGEYRHKPIEANAHLIAAAPDMYEALNNLENDDGKAMPPSAWKLVQDALAKARGE